MLKDELYVREVVWHKPSWLRFEWRKVGGIRFWRVGRLGGSFYVSR